MEHAQHGDTRTEYGRIEREIHIDASPEIVFEVISRPEHVREWWSDEAEFAPVPGFVGELSWGDRSTPDAHISPITVVDLEPPQRFSFRWTNSDGEVAAPGNSLLVTFELVPSGDGTLLKLTETGFRERGWEAAVLEQQYHEHCTGWDTYLPRLGDYAARLEASR